MKKVIGMLSAMILLLGLISGAYGNSDSATMSVSVGNAVPEINSVVVNDADPTSGTTTEITVTTMITDTDGVDDIDVVNTSFTVGTPAGGATITSMSRGICTGVDEDTIQCIATYDMQFYDDDMTYTVQVYAEDDSTASDTGSDTFAYSELLSLKLDATTIAFGSMTMNIPKEIPGDEDMGTSGAATIKNQGNAVIDASIYATDFVGNGIGSFGAGEADSQFGTLGYVALSNSPGRTETGLNLAIGASQLENINFKLTVPPNTLAETFTSTVTIVAATNS